MKFPIYGNIKNVPNHQPVYIYTLYDIQFSIVKQNPTFVSTLAAGCFMTIVISPPCWQALTRRAWRAASSHPPASQVRLFLRGSLLIPMLCNGKLPNCSQSLWFFESTTVNIYIYTYMCIYIYIHIYTIYIYIYMLRVQNRFWETMEELPRSPHMH